MADISTTNKKARVPILGENGRISDAYLPQAVIDAEASSKTYAENAKSYSELVKKDAESAASSAASAKESADAVREGISSIDEKVTQAGQFAEAASSSATEANNYLKQVTAVSDTVSGIASSVAENANTAETFANKSKESAASALTASTSAVNAKVDAEGYRDSAKSYSDNAKADADTAKNILESVNAQKADIDSTVQQFNTDATEYDTKFNGYVSEARESKEASAASATSASESAENASTSAVNASTSATNARTSADAAALSATNAANSAKEVADNLSLLGASTLTRKEKDTFIHVDDAFPTKLLGIEIEGATEQVTTTGKNIVKLTEGNETIQGLTVDVKASGQIIINGTCSGNGLWLKIGTVDVVEGKSYVLSLNKAYQSFGISAWSDSDNKHVIFAGAKNQVAKGTATKTETLSIFASGGEGMTFNNEVVSIQVEEGTSVTKWEPYTGGKPSPSHEYPQEIKVIENPVVKVTGRNLWPFASSYTSIEGHQNEFVNDKTPFTLFPGVYTFSAAGSLGNTDAPLFGYTATGNRIELFRIMRNVKNPKYSFTVTEPIDSIYFISNVADSNTGTISNIQLEFNSTATDYKPYTSQSIAFTLPVEHPYLAKLPDGTADKIVVDKDGNATLVAGVNRALLDKTEGWRFEKTEGGNGIYKYVENSRLGSPVLSKFGIGEYAFAPDKTFIDNAHFLFLIDSNLTTTDDIIAHFGSGSYVYYPLATNVTYHLGKVTVPSLPDSISNVWTDAEITPNTNIEYMRDVSIVVENLESAIASIS